MTIMYVQFLRRSNQVLFFLEFIIVCLGNFSWEYVQNMTQVFFLFYTFQNFKNEAIKSFTYTMRFVIWK